ncbi:K(+)-transporting ATPase subunit C [Paenibacillus zanthoxyli]|uniref:K(+)-transporting ATPase subunit C n=1 Tax=Paenibacillus zanthoxyli TaxID=369399 RepID=UPI0004705499|nr:K(+)-transporting ATPase subunit C [Paenibacillus zanthoxyli]
MKRSFKILRPALLSFIVMTVLCGIIYPGVITALSQSLMPSEANGSLITVKLKDGAPRTVGSALIGQPFTEARYLIGRPMGVSNMSPVSSEQLGKVRERAAWWSGLDPANKQDIPAELVTASGSGVDPNLSPAAAKYQADRIARARGIPVKTVNEMIDKYTTDRFLGVFGEPAVNVLKVNLALDGLL